MWLALALFAAGPVIAYAQSGDMKGMEMVGKSSASKGATHQANAVVKAVDATKSTETLAHGPVSS